MAADDITTRRLHRGSGIETLDQLVWCHPPDLCRDELDGEGHPLESPTDALDRLAIRFEGRVGVRGAIEKQLAGICVGVQRSDRPHPLLSQPQWLAGCGDQTNRRTAQGDCLDEGGGFVNHVLAVVEHQQDVAALQGVHEGVNGRGAGVEHECHHRSDRDS